MSLFAFEAWRRTIARAPETGALGPFRLAAGTTLLLLLVASPVHENSRVVEAYRVARAIRLPAPDRISATAVIAVRRAVDHVERFDLATELPAPVHDVDLSDLAYRLWHDGEARAPSASLIAYEVFDRSGMLRQPLLADSGGGRGRPGRPCRRAASSGISWPSSSRPRCSRTAARPGAGRSCRWPTGRAGTRCRPGSRCTGGSSARRRRERSPAPCSCSTARTELAARRGPTCRPRRSIACAAARREQRVRIRYRGEVLWGELRPMPDGFQLVAIPGPDVSAAPAHSGPAASGGRRALPAGRRDRADPRGGRPPERARSAASGRAHVSRAARRALRALGHGSAARRDLLPSLFDHERALGRTRSPMPGRASRRRGACSTTTFRPLPRRADGSA